MTTIKQRLGARVQELRKKKHLTQEVLAEKIEVTPNYLSGIERGRQSPSLDLLIKLAGNFDVEMWELFDFEHDQNLQELQALLKKLTKPMEKETFRQVVKVVRAMVR